MEKLSMADLNRKTMEEFKQAEKIPIVAVLENVRSAYNVGSVFRTSDAFLLQAVYLTGYTAFPPHKEIRKTALGAEDSVEWQHFLNIKDAIEQLRSSGYRILAVEQTVGSISLETVNFGITDKIAVIFGNEVSGVEADTLQLCDGCIEIPQLGMKHSLNIATAAGVVLWELIKKHIFALRSKI